MNTDVVISMRNIQKSYTLEGGMSIQVLKNINLTVHDGEFVAIMGESGGGKSTLMNVVGFLHGLDLGEYFFEGVDVSHAQNDSLLASIRNKKIGFIFQQFNLINKISALKNVALPGLYNGINAKIREEKAKELLTSVGLGDRVHHRPSELSGGQQQRVSIARSLINDPKIILADEPTGALDSQTGKEIMEMLCNYNKRGKTIVMITHDLHIAAQAHRIVRLHDGVVISDNYKIS